MPLNWLRGVISVKGATKPRHSYLQNRKTLRNLLLIDKSVLYYRTYGVIQHSTVGDKIIVDIKFG